MEIYENKDFTYNMSEEEETNLRNILRKTNEYLGKAGFRTFHLTKAEFEFLQDFCEARFDAEQKEEPIVFAERGTVESDAEIFEHKNKKKKK